MSRPITDDGPRVPKPGSRLKDKDPARPADDLTTHILRRGKRPVTVRVTYLPPSGRRKMHWSLGRCPVCGTPHLSRSRSLDDVTKVRTLPCGHKVTPVIARSLSPYERPREAA